MPSTPTSIEASDGRKAHSAHLVEVQNLSVTLQARRGRGRGGQERLVPHRPRRDAGACRRVGLRQVGDGARDHEAPAAHGACLRRQPRAPRGNAHRPVQRTADARRPRRPHLDDLPGADVVAEPDLPGRQPDRRGAHPAPAPDQEAGAGAGARSPEGGAHSRAGGAARAISASALRRAAAARDDRHGDRQQSGIPDRRRADDRARRDRSGGNPETDPAASGAARHGRAAHHPRPDHRREGQRQRRRDAKRPCGGDERDRARSSPRRAIPTRSGSSLRRRRAGRTRSRRRARSCSKTDKVRVEYHLRWGGSSPARTGCSSRSTMSAWRFATARRSASSASRAPARRRSARRSCGCIHNDGGEIDWKGDAARGEDRRRRCGRFAQKCRWCSRIRSPRSIPASR